MKKALIAMSGGVDSSVAALLMQQKGYECGMTEYMTKPINIANLRMRLEQILRT